MNFWCSNPEDICAANDGSSAQADLWTDRKCSSSTAGARPTDQNEDARAVQANGFFLIQLIEADFKYYQRLNNFIKQ